MNIVQGNGNAAFSYLATWFIQGSLGKASDLWKGLQGWLGFYIESLR